MALEFFELDRRRYARFPTLSRLPGLRHGITTRPHDLSPKKEAVSAANAAHRAAACRALGFPDPHRAVAGYQIHEPHIALVTATDAGRLLPDTDGLITAEPDLPLLTFSADCPLVLAYSAEVGAVGVVHASWRCTVAGITRRLVALLREHYGAPPASLRCGIGPSAGPTEYEVREDVYEAAAELPERDTLFPRRGDKMYFDLWRANTLELCRAGVAPENIECAEVCTMARTDLFFSYRREGAGCGNFALIAGVRSA